MIIADESSGYGWYVAAAGAIITALCYSYTQIRKAIRNEHIADAEANLKKEKERDDANLKKRKADDEEEFARNKAEQDEKDRQISIVLARMKELALDAKSENQTIQNEMKNLQELLAVCRETKAALIERNKYLDEQIIFLKSQIELSQKRGNL